MLLSDVVLCTLVRVGAEFISTPCLSAVPKCEQRRDLENPQASYTTPLIYRSSIMGA